MKRIVLIILFSFLLVPTAIASPQDDINSFIEEYDSSGKIEEIIEEKGFESLFEMLIEKVKEKTSILKNGAYLLGVVIIVSVMKNLSSDNTSKTVGFALTASIVSITLYPAINAISSVASYLRTVSSFLTAFTPVFSGIIAASGKVGSAGAGAYLILGLSSVISAAAGVIVIPLITLYLGLSFVSGVSGNINLLPICNSIKKISNVTLGGLVAVFSGVLALKTTVSAAADSVALRGIKFGVSSFIPVVGGALSEAVNAAGGYLNVVKSGFGVFGIIMLFCFFLPVAVDILLWILTLSVASFAADLTGESSFSALLSSTKAAFSVMWSITASFFILSIISIGIMLYKG